MASPLFTSPRVLFVVTTALLINSLLPSSVGGLIGGVIKPITDFVLMPVQAPAYRFAVSLQPEESSDSQAGPQTAEQLQEELTLAKVEIERLRQILAEKIQSLELLEGVKAQDITETKLLSANVIRFTDTGPRPILTIDRGRNDGIRPEMTVVYFESVVGRILSPVGPSTADVELITAHSTGLQVVARERETNTTFENLRAERKEGSETFTIVVARDSPITVGTDVLLADAVHFADARGRKLGVIENIGEHLPNPTLLQELIIRPDVESQRYPKQVAVLLPADSN